jgi:hypothetical protein
MPEVVVRIGVNHDVSWIALAVFDDLELFFGVSGDCTSSYHQHKSGQRELHPNMADITFASHGASRCIT